MTFRADGFRGLSISATVLAACLAAAPTSAQEPDGFLFLREVQEIPGAIDATILSQEMPFVVDDTATWVDIHVFATADDLLTSIEGPAAQMLDPATRAKFSEPRP